MAHTVSVESRSCELAYAIRLELSPRILEYWAQPFTAVVEREIVRPQRSWLQPSDYTPDFLVVATDSVYYVECKPERKLAALCASRPGDWKVIDNEVTLVPARIYFEKLGLPMRVWSAPEGAGILNANLELMSCVYWANPCPADEQMLKRARSLLAAGPCTLEELTSGIPGCDKSRAIRWIARGEIYSCLKVQLLCHELTTFVYLNRQDAVSRQAALMESSSFGGRRADQVLTSPILSAGACDLAIARKRSAAILPVLQGIRRATRNERRYLELAREAYQEGRSLDEALLGHTGKRGNRNRRLLPLQIKVVNRAISRIVHAGKKLTPKAVMARSDKLLDRLKTRRVGAESIRLMTREYPIEQAALARSGVRGFNQARPAIDPRSSSLRSEIPGQVAHVDSSQWDQRLWERLPWANVLPCPWWYVAYDEASSRCIGVSLAFGKADRFGLALLLRDVAATIGMLPNFVVEDRGAEFGSAWWQTTGAWLGMSQLDRDSGNPRSGSTVENGIGIAIKQFAENLLGSTDLDKAGRHADGRKKSRHFASYSLMLATRGLRSYMHDHFNKDPHGTDFGAPDDIWEIGRRDYPLIGRRIPCAAEWDIHTSIPIKNRARIDINKGIRTYYRTYTSTTLIARLRKSRPDDIRLNPGSPSIVYARFGAEWVEAYSRNFISQSSLPAEQQSAEIVVRRAVASRNRGERRQGAKSLDRRIDELNFTATRQKEADGRQGSEASGDAGPVQPEQEVDLFASIDWDGI